MKVKSNLKQINQKPYVARTIDGDYFFSNKEEAQAFALSRGGFFDTQENIGRSEKAKNLSYRGWAR